MGVRAELAGPVRLVVGLAVLDGRALGGALSQRVLAVLAMTEGPASRDQLGDAVWGDALPRTWEVALRGAVHKLRRAAAAHGADEIVRTAFGAYQLDATVAVDVLGAIGNVDDAERALDADDPGAAATAARVACGVLDQPFMAGLDGEWIDGVRSRLTAIRIRAHLALSAAATALGEHGAAVEAARAAVVADPFAEVAHRRLMTALAAAGDRAAALAAYRQCRELLAAELGVEPSAETDATRLAIARSGRRAAPVLPIGLPASLARALPLAGRGRELDDITGRLRRGSAGCVLVGEPGVGKSRLAAEVAWTQHQHGAVVIHAAIAPDDLGGLGSFAELLGQLDVAWPPPHLGGGASVVVDRTVLAEPVIEVLREVTARRPLVVVIDDLHWADRSTLAVLEHVVTAGIDGLRVVATARDEWRDAASTSPALLEHFEVVELAPLDRVGVGDLVAAWAGHLPGDPVLDAIVTRTGGNPLYVLAVVEDLAGRGGGLSRGLHVAGDVLERIPAGVVGIVAATLERLGPAVRAFAEAAAVLGAEVQVGTVRATLHARSDGSEPAADGAPGAGIDLQLVRASVMVRSPHDPTGLRWVHALVRDAVLAGVGSTERLALHRAIVQVLDDRHEDAPELVLRHLLAAPTPADAARVAELATVVADDLVERGRGDEATTVLRAALDALDVVSPGTRARVLMALAMAELSLDDVVAGRSHLFEAASLAVEVGDVSFLDHWWSAVSSRATGVDEAMIAVAERVIALTEPNSRRRVIALGWLTIELVAGPDMGRAFEVATDAMTLARRIGDQALVRQTVHTWHLAARLVVPASDRRAVLEEALGFRAPAGKQAADLLAWVTLAADCLQLGDATAAAGAVERALAGTAGFGPTHLRWIALRSDVLLATKDGRLEHAEAVGAEAAAMAAAMPWPDAPAIQVIQHILIRYHQGRLDEVQPFMAAVVEAAPDQVGALMALAFIEAELGHEHAAQAVDDVVQRIDDLRSAPAWIGQTAVVVEAMTKVGDPRTAEVADSLAAYSGQHAVIATVGYFGAVDRPLGLAAAAGGDVERARRLLSRAVDQHDAIGAPLYAERTRRELAALA